MQQKIRSFTDLNAWVKGHELVLSVYGFVEQFPKQEQYILTPQILRSSISITSNIAEGFGRKGYKEKLQFYYIAQSSLTELQNQLIIARDRKYLTKVDFENIWVQTVTVHKLTGGLIKSIKSKNH